ncbi:hypothetical protein H6G26_14110 [Nostoc sp. FACHB-888]|nr:hypothetical protein [Nostoc sp. FACHB-888]
MAAKFYPGKLKQSVFLTNEKRLFTEVLAPIAESLGAYVVDGATDAGVMQLIGEARTYINARFALIGVRPEFIVCIKNAWLRVILNQLNLLYNPSVIQLA